MLCGAKNSLLKGMEKSIPKIRKTCSIIIMVKNVHEITKNHLVPSIYLETFYCGSLPYI